MIRLRSILFNTLFYANLILRMIFLTPVYFLLPRKQAYAIPKAWARSSNWLFAKVNGTHFEIEGLENIPKSGGYILAPKHQSFWDTYALLPWLNDPVYILKRELMWIPSGPRSARMRAAFMSRASSPPASPAPARCTS